MSAHTVEQRIAAARSERRSRFITYGALALAIAALAGAVFYLGAQLDRGLPFAPPNEAAAPSDAADAPAAGAVAPSGDDAVADAVDEDDDDASRQAFTRELAQYEAEVEPRAAALQWPDGQTAPAALKRQAIEQFAARDYHAARESLRQARAAVAQAEAEHAQQLAAAKREARAAFAADDAPRAERALRDALRLSPRDVEMRALQPRIAALAEVLQALRQAEVANAENRPQKELAALQRALALDPARADVAARAQALQATLRTQRFAAAAARADAALREGDLNAAQQHIAAARAIDSAHAEVAALQSRLQLAQQQRAFDQAVARGAQAAQRDDWRAAVDQYQRALQIKPNDQSAHARRAQAQRIVDAGARIDRILAQPHRLGDRAALAAARAHAAAVEPLLADSAKLRARHRELQRAVAAWSAEVEVVVLSDNATEIIVRGEGIVGKTTRRTIRLRPGKRVFEGSRLGYQSKLVELDIAPGASGLEVSVICDQRI